MPLESSITLESQQNHQPRTEADSMPSPFGEVQPTRRSIVTIGVRSPTMQAWDRGNAGMHSKRLDKFCPQNLSPVSPKGEKLMPLETNH